MLDVLEHVRGSRRLVRQAAGSARAERHECVTVPAFDWLWTGHDDLNHHVKRYTRSQMSASCGAGLDVVEATYLFQSLVLPKLVVRAREALSAASPSVPRVPGRSLNAGSRGMVPIGKRDCRLAAVRRIGDGGGCSWSAKRISTGARA